MYTLFPITAAFSGHLSSSALWGYLDPGAGSMVLQVLIAGVFSSLFFAKSTFSYVREVLLAKKK